MSLTAARAVSRVLLAPQTPEGAGALVRRSIGTRQLRHLSPFLMLDHMHASTGAGFPDHPHRGQETISYILSGTLDHEDFTGKRGTLHPGDLQFMTAGRGVMHAEMPRPGEDGTGSEGLQLWVDLPERLKGVEPRYRDLRAAEIPVAKLDEGRVTVKVISGRSGGVDSVKDLAYTPVWMLDVEMAPGSTLSQPLPPTWNAFAYMLRGAADFSGASAETAAQSIQQHHIGVFERDGVSDGVSASVPEGSAEWARFVLVAGEVLEQPIVQRGPFVLTSEEEARQAMMDFYTHSNGFERAEGWESDISRESRTMQQQQRGQ